MHHRHCSCLSGSGVVVLALPLDLSPAGRPRPGVSAMKAKCTARDGGSDRRARPAPPLRRPALGLAPLPLTPCASFMMRVRKRSQSIRSTSAINEIQRLQTLKLFKSLCSSHSSFFSSSSKDFKGESFDSSSRAYFRNLTLHGFYDRGTHIFSNSTFSTKYTAGNRSAFRSGPNCSARGRDRPETRAGREVTSATVRN